MNAHQTCSASCESIRNREVLGSEWWYLCWCLPPGSFFSAGAFLLSRTQQRFLERNPEKAQWENVKMAIWDDWGLHFSAFNKWIIAVNFARWPKRKELFLHTKEGNQLDIYIYIFKRHILTKNPRSRFWWALCWSRWHACPVAWKSTAKMSYVACWQERSPSDLGRPWGQW